MKNSSFSDVEIKSWKYGKNSYSVIDAKEVKDIKEKVNKNFDEFKRIKWLNVRNASKEHRKGAQ